MASASAVGALIDEPGTDADARIVSDSHAPPAQFDGLTPGDPARWNIGTQLEGTELSVPAAESADPTASADSTETADSTASADSAETADSAANSTEPADPGMVRPAILATTGGNLIPLALLAAGLTCIGVSAVMTRRRTVPIRHRAIARADRSGCTVALRHSGSGFNDRDQQSLFSSRT